MWEHWLGGHSTRVKRGFIVMDSGANILKAVHDGGFVSIRYVVHVINLVV